VVVLAWAFFRLDISEASLLLEKVCSVRDYLELNFDSVFYQLPIWGFLLLVVGEHLLPHYEVTPAGEVALPGTGSGEPIRARRAMLQVSALFAASLLLAGHPLPFIYFNF
jgi:hypothetical protein